MRFQSRTTFYCSVACVLALMATSTFAAPDPTINTAEAHAKLWFMQQQGQQAQAPADLEEQKTAAAAERLLNGGQPEGPSIADTCATAAVASDGTQAGATNQVGQTNSGTAAGCGSTANPDQWWAYTATCTGVVSVDTLGTGDDTVVAVHADCTGAGSFACNDDINFPPGESGLSFASTLGNVYYIQVHGWGGGSTLAAYTLNISCVLPGDTCADAFAAADGANAGDTASGQTDSGIVPSCGSAANPDEWWEYVATCSGSATADTIGTGDDTILAVYSDCAGTQIVCNDDVNFPPGESGVGFATTLGNSYWIQIHGWGGGSTLASYALNISCTALTAQGADTCLSATVIGDGTINDLDGTSTSTIDGATACIGTQGPDDWFEYVATCTGTVSADTLGSGVDTILSIHTDCVGTEIACNDDVNFPPGESGLTFGSTVGNSYFIRVSGWGAATIGSYTLNLSCAPAGDSCGAAHGPIGEGAFAGETATKNPSGILTSCGSGSGNPVDEWWEYVPTCSGVATADTAGTGADTVLAVFSDCAGTEILCDDDGLGFPPGESSGTWNVTAGNSYWIRVSGWGSGTLASYALNTSCVAAVCGNGVQEPGEECDGADPGLCKDGCDVGCNCVCGSTIATCAGKLSQSGSMSDSSNQIACGAGGLTTPNSWARCFDLAAEGVTPGEGVQINSVTFGVSQATVDGINYNVNIYTDAGCPTSLGTATLIHSEPLVVNIVDVGTLIVVNFATPVQVLGGAVVVEIDVPDDGTVLGLATRPTANDLTDCGVSLLRAAACGAGDWTDLTLFGFPNANLALQADIACTPCGDGVIDIDEQCDPPDGQCCTTTCQYEPITTACGSAGTACSLQDTCTATGICLDNHLPSGFNCGAGPSVCHDQDSCDGSGACVVNNHALGTSCDDLAFCNGTDTCGDADGVCNSTGDPCAGGGTCNEVCNETADDCFDLAGAACDDGLFCTGVETCDGAGTCDSSGDPCVGGGECNQACNDTADDCFDLSGTACGAGASVCHDQDTCNGAGACDLNNQASGTPCGDGADTDCTDPDTCSGFGACNVNHAALGAPCGDASDTICTDPDTCDGSAGCLDNHEPSSLECRASVDACDPAEFCTGVSNDCPTDDIITTNINDDGCCPPGGTGNFDNDCFNPLVPTVSQWGMLTLTLLLGVGLWVKFGRRRESATA